MDAIHSSTDFGIGGSWLAEYTLQSVGAGVVLFDANGCAMQWDHTAPELLATSETELAGRSLHDDHIAMFWQDRSPLTPDDDPVAAVLESGATTSGLTVGVRTDDDGTRWLSINLLPVFGVDHMPRAVLVSLVDVTATVEARSSADTWHMALRSMTRASLAAVILFDRAGDILEWNEQVLRLTDRNEVDLLSARFSDVCDVDVDWLWAELDASDAGGVEGLTWVMHRLEREIAVHGRFSTIDHPVYGKVAMAQLLAPNEQGGDGPDAPAGLGAALFERSVMPLLVITDAGTIVDANPRASSLLRRSRTELIGDPVVAHLDGISSDDLHRAIIEAKASPTPVAVRRPGPAGPDQVSVMISTTVSDAPASLLLVQLTGGTVTEPMR